MNKHLYTLMIAWSCSIACLPILTFAQSSDLDVDSILKVDTSTEAIGYLFEVEDLPTVTRGGVVEIIDDPDASNARRAYFNGTKAGDYVEFTIDNLHAGYYQLALSYKKDSQRGGIITTVNGVTVGGFLNQIDRVRTDIVRHLVGSFFHKAAGPLTIRFTHIGAVGGSRPGLSFDQLFIDAAPVRNAVEKGDRTEAGSTGNLRVDAIALARQLLPTTPAPGPLHAPFYALPPYNPDGSDIPADALDRKDFPSIKAWLTAMEIQEKPGKIGSGNYMLDPLRLKDCALTQSIYGYDSGGGIPVLDGQGRSSLFYLRASNIHLEYLHFKDIGIPIISIDNWKAYSFGAKKGLLHWSTYQAERHPDKVHAECRHHGLPFHRCRYRRAVHQGVSWHSKYPRRAECRNRWARVRFAGHLRLQRYPFLPKHAP